MSSLPTQPLRVDDYSGGITDNFIGGGPTRYMAANNFWVTVDRKLEERYGSQILAGNAQLPSGNSPVNALIPHDNESYLLGVACPNIYVLNPNWQSILGPTGNPPMAGSNYLNVVAWGEWSHHTIVTNDSLNSKPVKIYRGAALPTTFPAPTTFPSAPAGINNFQAVTAGLPAMVSSQNIATATALQSAILLANDLRTQMIAHFTDTSLHQNSDTTDAAVLTGTPIAVDQTTLLTLVAALISAYTPHVNDVIANVALPSYHFAILGVQVPLNYYLTNTTAPTLVTVAASILDDIKTKFFMHEMAPYTHDGANNYATIGKHLVTAPHIGTISSGPIVTPVYTQSLTLANSFRTAYNAHLGDTTEHIIADTVDLVSFPPAIDLDSLYILIIHLRFQYGAGHLTDANQKRNLTFANSTATSPNLVTLVTIGTSNNYTPVVGDTIWDANGLIFSKAQQPVTVLASPAPGVGTCTASANAINNETTYNALDFTASKYHISQLVNTAEFLGGTALGYFQIVSDPTAASLQFWIALLTQAVASYNVHDSDSTTHLAVNLHQVTPTNPMIASYAYALHYFYQYMRYDGVIFNVVGPPILVGPIQSEAISQAFSFANPSNNSTITVPATTIGITNIPVLSNGGQDNYDVTNVQIKIFRTINAGSTYYQTGLISNGTTTFTDTIPDAANPNLPALVPLQQQPVIYTSGGVVNFDPAPVCKYVTVLANTAYYGAVIDNGQTFLNRVRQSIQNNIDSSPGSFFVDLTDNLMGVSSTRNIPVAFCANSVHQLSGSFTQTGQGQINSQSISDRIGCVSSASIVQTDVGIFFAGTDGFYYTDGFQLIKLSSEFDLSYAALVLNSTQRKNIYGCYDRYNRRVWWSTQPVASDSSATKSYIFHVNFGVTAKGVFTTASNFENYRPSSMIFWQGQQYRGDSRGYLFLHSILSKTDPQVNIQVSPTLWNTVYVPYNYASCAMDFGTTFNRKWLTRISMQGKNVGNVGAQITSISDNGRVPPLTLSPIWYHPNIYWGQPNVIWGAPNAQQPLVWDWRVEMDVWRRFPATQLRADYKQISITPAKIGVYRYQDWPIGAGANIMPQGGGIVWVKLIQPSGYQPIPWPSDCVGYTFSSQLDGYVAEYPITGFTSLGTTNDTLILSDPGNVLSAATAAWVLRGFLKQQRLSLTSYTIHFTLLGKMQQAYRGAQDSGENAMETSFSNSPGRILTEGGDALETEGGSDIDTEN